MRMLPLPLALLLAAALVAGCMDGSPTEPATTAELDQAGSLPTLSLEDGEILKKKKKLPPGKKKRIGPVIDNNLPDGKCPPPFTLRRAVLDRDRNGDGWVCVRRATRTKR